jgi:hypothetical protein
MDIKLPPLPLCEHCDVITSAANAGGNLRDIRYWYLDLVPISAQTAQIHPFSHTIPEELVSERLDPGVTRCFISINIA